MARVAYPGMDGEKLVLMVHSSSALVSRSNCRPSRRRTTRKVRLGPYGIGRQIRVSIILHC